MKKIILLLTLLATKSYGTMVYQGVSPIDLGEINLMTQTVPNITLTYKNSGPSADSVSVNTSDLQGFYRVSINRCTNVAINKTCQITLSGQRKQVSGGLNINVGSVNIIASVVKKDEQGNIIPEVPQEPQMVFLPAVNQDIVFSPSDSMKNVSFSVINNGPVAGIPNLSWVSNLNNAKILINRCSSSLAPTKTCSVTISFNKPVADMSQSMLLTFSGATSPKTSIFNLKLQAELLACSFNGNSVAHGSSVNAYDSSSVPFGQTCVSEQRVCNNGVLSGSKTIASCSVELALACSFNGNSIVSGQSVTAYQSSSVAFGETCLSESRGCENGVLSGTFENASCEVSSGLACDMNETSVLHGQSITTYPTSSVPANETCQPEVRVCNNGSLSGMNTILTCSVDPEVYNAVWEQPPQPPIETLGVCGGVITLNSQMVDCLAASTNSSVPIIFCAGQIPPNQYNYNSPEGELASIFNDEIGSYKKYCGEGIAEVDAQKIYTACFSEDFYLSNGECVANPVVSGFVINNDNLYTNQSQVSFQISMFGSEMAIFNNSTCSGVPSWQPFSSNVVRNIYSLNSLNNFSIKTKTAASIESDCETRSIIHDNTVPTIITSLSGLVSIDNPLALASTVYSTNLVFNDANLTGLVNYQSFDSSSCQIGTEINSFSASGNALSVSVLVGQTVSIQAQVVDKAGNETILCLPFYLALQSGVSGGSIVAFDINQSLDSRCLVYFELNNQVQDLTYLFPDASSCNQSRQFARLDSATQTISPTGDVCTFSDNSLFVPEYYSYEDRYLVPDQTRSFPMANFLSYYVDENLNLQTENRCEGPANVFYEERTSTQDSWLSSDFAYQLSFSGKSVPATNSSILYPRYLKRSGSLMKVGNKIYFSAYTPEFGNELYVYEISSRQVSLVKDIVIGENSTHPMLFATDGTSLFFVAHDYRIYKTQGTEFSTEEVSNGPTNIKVTSDDLQTSEMIVIGSKLYYTSKNCGVNPTCIASLDINSHVESVVGSPLNEMYGSFVAKNMTHFNGRLYFWKKSSSSSTRIFYLNLANSTYTIVGDITSNLANSRHSSIYSSASKSESEKVFIHKNLIDNELYYTTGSGVTRVTSSLTTDTNNYNRFLFYEGCIADSTQTYIYCFTNGLGVIRYPKGGTTGGLTTVIASPTNQATSITPFVFGDYIYYGSRKLHVPSGKSNEAFITTSFSPEKYFTAMDSSFDTQVYALGSLGASNSAVYKASTWSKNPSANYVFKYGSTTYETLPLNHPLPNSLTLTIQEVGSATGTFTVTIENDDLGAFTLSSNNCVNKNLALNATCTVQVTVNPNVTSEGLIHATLVFGGARLEMYKVITYSPLYKQVGTTPNVDIEGYSQSTGDGLFYRSFVPEVGSEVFFYTP